MTNHATIESKGLRKIVVGLIDGDLIELRLRGEQRRIYIPASAVFRYALALDVARIKREKAAAKKAKRNAT